MEILTSVERLYISFKSLVNDFVYSFGRAALLLLVEVQNHTVPVRERRRIRVKFRIFLLPTDFLPEAILSLIIQTEHIFKLISRFCGYYFIFKRKKTHPHQGTNIGLGQKMCPNLIEHVFLCHGSIAKNNKIPIEHNLHSQSEAQTTRFGLIKLSVIRFHGK